MTQHDVSTQHFLLNHTDHCPAPTPPKPGCYSNCGNFSLTTHSAAVLDLEGLSCPSETQAVGGGLELAGCSLLFLFLSISANMVVVVGSGFQYPCRALSAGHSTVLMLL